MLLSKGRVYLSSSEDLSSLPVFSKRHFPGKQSQLPPEPRSSSVTGLHTLLEAQVCVSVLREGGGGSVSSGSSFLCKRSPALPRLLPFYSLHADGLWQVCVLTALGRRERGSGRKKPKVIQESNTHYCPHTSPFLFRLTSFLPTVPPPSQNTGSRWDNSAVHIKYKRHCACI